MTAFGTDLAREIALRFGRAPGAVATPTCTWVGPGMPANLPSGPSPTAVDVQCRGDEVVLGWWQSRGMPPPPTWLQTGEAVTVWDRVLEQYLPEAAIAKAQNPEFERCAAAPELVCYRGKNRWLERAHYERLAAQGGYGRVPTGREAVLPPPVGKTLIEVGFPPAGTPPPPPMTAEQRRAQYCRADPRACPKLMPPPADAMVVAPGMPAAPAMPGEALAPTGLWGHPRSHWIALGAAALVAAWWWKRRRRA